jgi:ribosomal-protein-alanine N-acetyltransferase
MARPPFIAVVRMDLSHISAVMDIERESFSDPWSEDAWLAELVYDDSWCYVAVDAVGTVAGALALRKVLDEVHVMKLAVRPGMRRGGIATALVTFGLGELRKNGSRRACLELRKSNHAAAAFYQKLGFSPEGERKGYYRKPAEDALLMSRKLS